MSHKEIQENLIGYQDFFDLNIDFSTDFISPPRAPAQLVVSSLQKTYFYLSQGKLFVGRKLPAISLQPKPNFRDIDIDQYVALHNAVTSAGLHYPAGTPNYLGARIPLPHNKLNLAAWTNLLSGTNNTLLDYITFGFPLGLEPNCKVESSTKNHSSSYMYYSYVDKFINTEIEKGGLVGPFNSCPMDGMVVSPLMTAHKNPSSRRTVYDATFGEHSINNNTPKDFYMGVQTEYDFPSVDDFEELLVSLGKGALMWKKDLARYYMQLPMDPCDYNKTAFIWREQLFFFIGLMFGLRHSGLAGQHVTSAVSAAHNSSGRMLEPSQDFNSLNYSDDLGGAELGIRSWLSFYMMGALLEKLGLEESTKKASPPSTDMIYLSVRFNTITQQKSVPPEKLAELQDILGRWSRKTLVTKKDLQSLVGKLMSVAKVVRHSRVFVCRLLSDLKRLHNVAQHSKILLQQDTIKDILWWNVFLRKFNGVDFLIPRSLDNVMMEYHGDACLTGGGGVYMDEYWSRILPENLQGAPIHVLEFWVMIASITIWGPRWSGSKVIMYCDNDSCCDVINFGRPKDKTMVDLFREFTYRVCVFKFDPVVRKISSEANLIADYVSRNHVEDDHRVFFLANDIDIKKPVEAKDDLFLYSAPW